MARSLALAGYFTPEELLKHYRRAPERVERTHWQVLYLKSLGKSAKEIGQVVGYSEGWVLKLIRRYNKEGQQAIADRRREHAGSKPMLNEEQQAELARELEKGRASDGGLWNGPKVARWIEGKTGRAHVHDQRGWDYLLRLGFSAQSPRPRHQGTSEGEQEAFKRDAAPTSPRAPGR